MKRQDELNEAWCKYMGKFSTEIMQALAFALRWCDEHPHWISVKEQLPSKKNEYVNNSILVLSTDGNNVYKSRYLYQNQSNECLSGWFTYDLYKLDNITHWMPLPEAPSSSEFPNNSKKGDEE